MPYRRPVFARPLDMLAAVAAIAGPAALVLVAAWVSGRGASWPFPWMALPIGGAMVVGLCRLALRRRKPALLLAGALAAGMGAFFMSFAPRTPPATLPPYPFELPPAHPPREMSIRQVVTGVIERTAAFAYRGGGFDDRRTFTMNAVLVQHPAGDLLIDTGFGHDIAVHLAQMPLPFQWLTRLEPRTPARSALAAAGYDPRKLHGIVLTHAHWDHVSGAGDLAPTPMWLPKAERAFIGQGWISEVARHIDPERLQTYAFEDGPYLHYSRSYDVFDDGSVVIVPAPGHTPGSVIVFVNVPSGQRYALVGDLAWQVEGILLRQERPWLTRLGDSDPAAVRKELAMMAALHARYPAIDLVPAHDPRAYARIPRL